MKNPEPHDFQMLTDDLSPRTTCAVCGLSRSAPTHQPPRYMVPELQIHISEEGLTEASDVIAGVIPNLPENAYPEIAGKVIAAALASPPTVTEQTVETLVRALLATYPDHRWGGIKLREMVEGLLLSLGVEVSSQP